MEKIIEEYKELDDLLLDEINVKEYTRDMGIEGDGLKISLVYNRKERKYYWEIDKRRMESSDKAAFLFLSSFYASLHGQLPGR